MSRISKARCLLLPLTCAVALMAGGCASIDPVFKAQAESDLECKELEVELERTEHSDIDKTRERRVYIVTGCGQTARYETTCIEGSGCGQYRRIED